MTGLSIVTVPVITTATYGIIQALKTILKNSEKFKTYIPIISCVIGGLLGIAAFYFAPEYQVGENVIGAIIAGCVSGWSATGVNQVFKQISKSEE